MAQACTGRVAPLWAQPSEALTARCKALRYHTTLQEVAPSPVTSPREAE